jgi:hypothetical protein
MKTVISSARNATTEMTRMLTLNLDISFGCRSGSGLALLILYCSSSDRQCQWRKLRQVEWRSLLHRWCRVSNSHDATFVKAWLTVDPSYQPGGSSGVTDTSDPLTDGDACLRDAILLQRLGVNTIRVYNLIADLNHDECASIFNAAGIHMILDVNNGFSGSNIDRSAPWTTYTSEYLNHVFSIIEAFAPYPNLIGFFSGNEIINEQSAYNAPAYIRAVTRDMKDYIAKNINREISVGYSAADVASVLSDTWEYLGCELSNSTSSKIDFFGLNDYEW